MEKNLLRNVVKVLNHTGIILLVAVIMQFLPFIKPNVMFSIDKVNGDVVLGEKSVLSQEELSDLLQQAADKYSLQLSGSKKWKVKVYSLGFPARNGMYIYYISISLYRFYFPNAEHGYLESQEYQQEILGTGAWNYVNDQITELFDRFMPHVKDWGAK